MASINFFSDDSDFKLNNSRRTASWIGAVIKKEKFKIDNLTYIFCSDERLLAINKEFLHHNTFTDIITFDYSDSEGRVNGEIYISVDRVRENALKFKVLFDDEVHRVIIHGVLHLMGFADKKPSEKARMRKKEEACLSLRGQ